MIIEIGLTIFRIWFLSIRPSTYREGSGVLDHTDEEVRSVPSLTPKYQKVRGRELVHILEEEIYFCHQEPVVKLPVPPGEDLRGQYSPGCEKGIVLF